MTDQAVATGRKTPIWFWIVGVLAVIWNFGGAFDYVMTKTNPAYMDSFTPEQVAYFTSFPAWFTAVWATAVFAAFFASVGLLLRTRFSFHLFALSLVLYVVSSIHTFLLSDGGDLMGAGGAIFSVFIFASLVALTWLSRWATKAEILR